MSLPLVYRREVQNEIDDAYQEYESQQPGLGNRFIAAIRQLLKRIEENPQLYGVHYKDVQADKSRRFPFGVYYRIEPARVLVLAVRHGHRNPRDWKSRV
jgi:plasmid stabilization system protein ParE